MRNQQTIDTLVALFTEGASVAICGHVSPDGDSIGSALALAAWCTARGCRVTKLLAREQEPPRAYSFLSGYDFVPADRYDEVPDIFVAVDLSQASRLDKALKVLQRARTSVVIDHHQDPESFADHLYHDPEAAATGLLVWQLILASGEAPTPAMAMACYVALVTDTGRFTYQNTSGDVLRSAAEMVEAGADPVLISREVYDSRSLGALLLEARLVERLEYLLDGKLVLSWVTKDDFNELKVGADEGENLVHLLRSLAGAELAVLLRWDGHQVRANLRSRNEYNVSCMASDFGGGGHAAAAGFNFPGTLEQAKSAILHYIESEGILAGEGTSSSEPGGEPS